MELKGTEYVSGGGEKERRRGEGGREEKGKERIGEEGGEEGRVEGVEGGRG